MGHARISNTLDLYGHLFPSLDVELADRLEITRADALRHVCRVVEPAGGRVGRPPDALTSGSSGGRGRF